MPTAVFCANDAMALGLMKFAEQNGISIPKDLAVVGFDDVDGAQFSSPQLTTIRVYKEQFGELAMRYLTDMLDGSWEANTKFERGNHMLTVPAELVIRASV